MKKKFIDPNIKNKSVTVENRIQLIHFDNKKLPLPTEIEISESGTCNRKCSFCPRSDPEFIHKKEFISKNLDYISNTLPIKESKFPNGSDIEIFKSKLFRKYKSLTKEDKEQKIFRICF